MSVQRLGPKLKKNTVVYTLPKHVSLPPPPRFCSPMSTTGWIFCCFITPATLLPFLHRLISIALPQSLPLDCPTSIAPQFCHRGFAWLRRHSSISATQCPPAPLALTSPPWHRLSTSVPR